MKKRIRVSPSPSPKHLKVPVLKTETSVFFFGNAYFRFSEHYLIASGLSQVMHYN